MWESVVVQRAVGKVACTGTVSCQLSAVAAVVAVSCQLSAVRPAGMHTVCARSVVSSCHQCAVHA